VTRWATSEQNSFAMAASRMHGPWSNIQAARSMVVRATSTSIAMRASLNLIAWNVAMALPNCLRCLA
jgi:hypothetical protein